MGASVTTCVEIAVELLNRSDIAAALGAISGSQEFLKSGEFNRVLILADAKRARLICYDRSNPARKVFLTGTQSGIANGGQINQAVGPIETIQFVITGGRWAGTHRAGNPPGADPDLMLRELSIENRNVTANPEIAPHFVQDGQTVFHNAAGLILGSASAVSVNASFCQFTINFSATSLQCPDEWTRSIVADALAMQFGKDGHRSEAVALFTRLAQEDAPTQ
jgi:hypothetical protein